MDHKRRPVKVRKRDEDLTQAPKRLHWRRHAAGMTLRDLAGASGLGIATISDLENGYYSAEPGTLAALADALGCEITDLMPPEPAATHCVDCGYSRARCACRTTVSGSAA